MQRRSRVAKSAPSWTRWPKVIINSASATSCTTSSRQDRADLVIMKISTLFSLLSIFASALAELESPNAVRMCVAKLAGEGRRTSETPAKVTAVKRVSSMAPYSHLLTLAGRTIRRTCAACQIRRQELVADPKPLLLRAS